MWLLKIKLNLMLDKIPNRTETGTMNKLPLAKRAQIIGLLVEGTSLRATSRLADVSINTVTKLLVDIGTACEAFQHATLVNLNCKRIQVDEIWAFVGCKQKNVSAAMPEEEGYGDAWTWVAIDADSKLAVSWLVGHRDSECAQVFMQDVASRLATRVQLTSDGHRTYLDAVKGAFGLDVDFAQLIKVYEGSNPNRRYSPARYIGSKKEPKIGKPDMGHVSTSFVERQNLTMRMSMRRFTRLTNGFSKKIENHCHAVALHFAFYNFCRVHKTLRVTPAMEAGIADHVWSIEDIVGLI